MKSRLCLTTFVLSWFAVLSLHAPPPRDWPAVGNFAQSPRLPHLVPDWSPGPSPDSSPSATIYQPPPVMIRKRTYHRRLPDYDHGHYAQGVPHVRVDRLPEIKPKRYLRAIPVAEESYEPDLVLKDRVNRWLNLIEASAVWGERVPAVGNGWHAGDDYLIDRNESDHYGTITPRNGRAWPVTPGRIRPQRSGEGFPQLY